MARKRTSVNPDFFRKKVVTPQVVSDESTNDDDITSNDVFVKGGKYKKHENTYKHRGGDEDIFIINNGNDSSFQLHRKTLKEILKDLRSQAHVKINSLSPKYTESLNSILETLNLLYDTPKVYDIILADISQVFGDLTNVKQGTLGAHFIGCFGDSDNFSGPIGCNPKCVSSLQPTEGTHGYKPCSDLVLVYNNETFSALNDKKSSHAYILIDDDKFKCFSQYNIDQLNDSNISSATLIFNETNSSNFKTIAEPYIIQNLPVCQTVNVAKNNQTTSNSGWVIILILIILIILLVAAFMYRKHGFQSLNSYIKY